MFSTEASALRGAFDAMSSLLAPQTAGALGWTLVHFIWQGTLLAVLLSVFYAFCRTATVRYWAGVATLAAMVAVPVWTFLGLRNTALTGTMPSVPGVASGTAALVAAASALPGAAGPVPAYSDWLAWFTAAWFAGVVAFAVRALGGWLLVERLCRTNRKPVSDELLARCRQLAAGLGITRRVRFYASRLVDAPAVIGWMRPVVLVPVAALASLSPDQLEAILVHELAHVRRMDCLVNLFQIATETLLFYHPAVWWVSKSIRAERENCCDDIAVAACGDVGVYARALTVVETSRSMPSLVLAATSSPLKLRIERLLGLRSLGSHVFPAGTAAAFAICAAGVVFAATGMGPAQQAAEQASEAEIAAHQPEPAPKPSPARKAQPAPKAKPDGADLIAQARDTKNAEKNDGAQTDGKGSSYIEGLQAAGIKDINVDMLIAAKIQGVTPDYIREMRAAGVTANIGELIGMKVQGIAPEYVRKMREQWPGISTGEIIAMKVQGIDSAYAGSLRAVGLDHLDVGQLIAMKVQAVTPDYVKGLQKAGVADLDAGKVIAAKVQGVTPDFVEKARSHGFTNLTIDQLIGLKMAGVF